MEKEKVTLLIRNIGRLITGNRQFAEIQGAAIAFTNDRISWIGSDNEASKILFDQRPECFDAQGQLATAGLIDAHTHLVFAGSRQHEFAMRLGGKSYQEIAAAGGGILSSMAAFHKANDAELLRLGKQRLDEYLQQGVTTVEAKSGYGLSHEQELRCLRLLKQLQRIHPIEIVTTYMGAHAIPPEFSGRRSDFLSMITNETLPQVAAEKLAEFCDVFCDVGAFTINESALVLEAALKLGLKIKLHIDEFENLGGAELAARLKATSVDHLCKLNDQGIQSLAKNGVVGVVLPGTSLTLQMTQYAPARAMLQAGMQVAIATDFNPGSNCSQNLLLTATLACLQLRLLPSEAWRGLTQSAAAAIHRQDRLGSLEIGKQADLNLFEAPDIDYLFYHYGSNHLRTVFKKGKIALQRSHA
jgi:imidazolonepropionase